MIIPIRCFSCGTVIAHKWDEFNNKLAEGTSVSDALDDVGLARLQAAGDGVDGVVELADRLFDPGG